MKPFFEETETTYRALLSSTDDVLTNGDNAEIAATAWYDEEPPMDQLIKKAKELEKDIVTIEEATIVQRSYEVK